MFVNDESLRDENCLSEMGDVDDLHLRVNKFLKTKDEIKTLINTAHTEDWHYTKYYLEKALEALQDMD